MIPAMTQVEQAHQPISPRDDRLAAWRTFLQAYSLLSRRLDVELQQEQAISLAEYDALVQLAEAPGHRLRMSQLAERVLLSRSGVTRLVDRLEADGLVKRSQCSTDARGAEAVLTETGVARLRSASVTHLRGVADYFLEAVPAQDLDALARSLGAVVDRVGQGQESATAGESGGLSEPGAADSRHC
jgi:DNA-binding MarR family transcriptional regulator